MKDPSCFVHITIVELIFIDHFSILFDPIKFDMISEMIGKIEISQFFFVLFDQLPPLELFSYF